MSQTLDRLLCEMHRERLHSTRDLGLLLYVARCGGRAEFWAVERASGSVPHLVAQSLVNLEGYGLVKLTRTASEHPMIDVVELAEPGWDRVTELTAVIIGEIDRAATRGRWPYDRREGQKGQEGLKGRSPLVGTGSDRRRLHELQRLVLSAQSTMSVDDCSDALAGAQRIISELIANAEQQPTISGNGGMGVVPALEKSPGGELGGSLPGAWEGYVAA